MVTQQREGLEENSWVKDPKPNLTTIPHQVHMRDTHTLRDFHAVQINPLHSLKETMCVKSKCVPVMRVTASGTSLVVHGLRFHLPMQEVQAGSLGSLVGELRSHMPRKELLSFTESRSSATPAL